MKVQMRLAGDRLSGIIGAIRIISLIQLLIYRFIISLSGFNSLKTDCTIFSSLMKWKVLECYCQENVAQKFYSKVQQDSLRFLRFETFLRVESLTQHLQT